MNSIFYFLIKNDANRYIPPYCPLISQNRGLCIMQNLKTSSLKHVYSEFSMLELPSRYWGRVGDGAVINNLLNVLWSNSVKIKESNLFEVGFFYSKLIKCLMEAHLPELNPIFYWVVGPFRVPA